MSASIDSATVPDQSKGSHAAVIALIALGQVIVATDFCVTSVALASIGRDLRMGPDLLPWLATTFALSYAGALILCGRLADLFGHRRLCILGLLFFGLGSIGTTVSPSFQTLIISRVLEGLGGACLTPTSFSLINVLLPEGAVRNKAFSVFGITQGLSYIFGLYGGGALVTTFGWRSAFLLNLPAIIAAIALAWQVIPPRKPVSAKVHIDAIGAVLITSSVGLLLYAMSALNKFGWMSLAGGGAFGGGCLLLALLYIVEKRQTSPLIPLSLFRYPNLVGADLATIFMVGAAASVFVLWSLFMQRALHFSAETTGIGMIPNSLAVVAGGQLAGRNMSRVSLRRSIGLGLASFLVGIIFVSLAAMKLGYVLGILPGMVAIGFGSTIVNLSLMAMSTAAVPPEYQNLASAVLMTSQQIGVALGISITFAVIEVVQTGGAADGLRLAFLSAAALGAFSAIPVLFLTTSARRYNKSEKRTPAL